MAQLFVKLPEAAVEVVAAVVIVVVAVVALFAVRVETVDLFVGCPVVAPWPAFVEFAVNSVVDFVGVAAVVESVGDFVVVAAFVAP